jgi:hypothetical protein
MVVRLQQIDMQFGIVLKAGITVAVDDRLLFF